MALTKYKQKRSPSKTPEPMGGKPTDSSLRFVVQKHAASHLHYDFRLEMEGVLKSWAVPKGPSMDPTVKRLAMMVEDHPFDYRSFEGIIPKGDYGGGTVMVWDEGTYEPSESKSKEKAVRDKELRHQLHAGKLKFILHGKKLKGEFALVKAKGRGENSWLLMKLNDKYASTEDILLKDRSVLSRKTIEGITKTSTNIYGQNESTTNKDSIQLNKIEEKSRAKAPSKVKALTAIKRLLPKTKPKKFPTKLTPMLATLADKPFHDPGWVYEVKWDGYRALAFLQPGTVELRSRNDKSFNEKFYPIYDALSKWKLSAVLDGEIVVITNKGLSNFASLQNWRSEADGTLFYYLFDILWIDGKDLTTLPLVRRKEILKKVIPENETIRISEMFESTGTEFYDIAKQMGLEGIMAKKSDSLYHPGERTKEWLKIKISKHQEVIIGGYTQNEGSSKLFSSLLVGVYEGGKLRYTGKIGTGFSDSLQKELMAQFESRVIKKSPFEVEPDVNKPSRFRPDPPRANATWLKPELVCEVSFTEMTDDGVMRHPSFEGMRVDKNAKEVIPEHAASTTSLLEKQKELVEGKLIVPSTADPDRRTLLNPTDETQVREVSGHSLKFTNLSKIYWPKERVTKRDMINYYYQVAPYILPYLKDRPQSLNRFPDGIEGKSFYQKNVTGKVPEWVTTYLYHSNDEETDKHFLVPVDEAAVLLMASMGCIELNPWSSRIQKPDHPDWCIIDLDPDKNSFDQVVTAAQVTKKVLDSLNVPSYCKTSGSTGLHIYIPLGAKYTYEQSKEFARTIATMVHRELPKFTSIERKVADRSGKMYVDFLQNRPKATLAAPYSLRPKPGATVSMPLHWDEVKKGLTMKRFTIFNAIDRIKSEGDLFKGVLGEGIDLEKAIAHFRSR
jgi:bifunctional non-homologous end joining protein LigD